MINTSSIHQKERLKNSSASDPPTEALRVFHSCVPHFGVCISRWQQPSSGCGDRQVISISWKGGYQGKNFMRSTCNICSSYNFFFFFDEHAVWKYIAGSTVTYTYRLWQTTVQKHGRCWKLHGRMNCLLTVFRLRCYLPVKEGDICLTLTAAVIQHFHTEAAILDDTISTSVMGARSVPFC